jgi:acyl-CoA thioesterase FadM
MSGDKLLGTRVAEGVVKPEWIDVNGHMNVAYYVLAFDLAVDALWEGFGITAEYIKSSYGTTFAVESHVTYQQELMEGDPYIVTAQILAYDDKRIQVSGRNRSWRGLRNIRLARRSRRIRTRRVNKCISGSRFTQ